MRERKIKMKVNRMEKKVKGLKKTHREMEVHNKRTQMRIQTRMRTLILKIWRIWMMRKRILISRRTQIKKIRRMSRTKMDLNPNQRKTLTNQLIMRLRTEMTNMRNSLMELKLRRQVDLTSREKRARRKIRRRKKVNSMQTKMMSLWT